MTAKEIAEKLTENMIYKDDVQYDENYTPLTDPYTNCTLNKILYLNIVQLVPDQEERCKVLKYGFMWWVLCGKAIKDLERPWD